MRTREPGHRLFAGPTDGTRHPRGGPFERSPKARRRRLMRRLVLVRHGSTDAVRAAAFGADEPLDAGGRAAASRLAARLPRGEVLVSPARRALETAAGLGPCRVVPELMECDFGRWAGLTLGELAKDDLGAWMTDPDAAPHGGESLSALLAR